MGERLRISGLPCRDLGASLDLVLALGNVNPFELAVSYSKIGIIT